MSDEKRLTITRYEAHAIPSGCECCGPEVKFDEWRTGEWVKFSDVDAAVARERREAAAEALERLAAEVRATTGLRVGKPSDPFWRDHFATLAEKRAAVERGES